MASSNNWILNPLEVIDKLFENNSAITSENVRDCFSKLLEDKENLSQIPTLNDVASQDLPSGSLVRFRCMIQDMFDPEYFLGKYAVRQVNTGQKRDCCGLHRDIITSNPDEEEIDFDAPENATMERQTLYCIPIPGENPWVKEAYSKLSQKAADGPTTADAGRQKRNLDNEDDGVTDSALMNTVTELSNKRPKCSDSNGGSDASKSSVTVPDLNFPLPLEKGPACILKVYDQSCDLKLNDMIDVIGIFSADPGLALLNKQLESSPMMPEFMEISEEFEARNPPPSLVPRLHAILVRSLNQNNPYLEPDATAFEETEDQIEGVREQLLAVLEQMLLGDRLAAEYLLCHLISSVYHRQDVVSLGKFSLNLSRFPADNVYTKQVYSVISSLVAKSHFLPMSLSNMNTLKFVPHKDYKLNRLQTGMLQLSARTHLIIDETALEAGQLDVTGVNNITALGNVITWQKLDYDFDYHKQAFPTDIAALVLSEGKSILKCDCLIPLLPASSTSVNFAELFNGISAYLTPVLLEQIRKYLGKAQLCTYNVSSDMQKLIESDFVNTRKEDQNAMTVDCFHTLLTLTRLLSMSHGKTCPTEELWVKAKTMESARKERISHLL